MAIDSKIEWTGPTWNPIAGCSLESPGCANCYAMRMAARLEGMGQSKYAGLTKRVNGRPVWNGVVRLDDAALELPLRWKKPRTIFVNSMSDLFHPDVREEWIDAIFAIMRQCPQHTFQILTKRPGRATEYLFANQAEPVLPHILIGASIEDQKRLDERMPFVAEIERLGWRTMISAEPLLGHLKFGPWLQYVDWLIVGGESGPGARPCTIGFIREIMAECVELGVPLFVKQLGSRPVNREGRPHPLIDQKGGDPAEWPADLRVREFPKLELAR